MIERSQIYIGLCRIFEIYENMRISKKLSPRLNRCIIRLNTYLSNVINMRQVNSKLNEKGLIYYLKIPIWLNWPIQGIFWLQICRSLSRFTGSRTTKVWYVSAYWNFFRLITYLIGWRTHDSYTQLNIFKEYFYHRRFLWYFLWNLHFGSLYLVIEMQVCLLLLYWWK